MPDIYAGARPRGAARKIRQYCGLWPHEIFPENAPPNWPINMIEQLESAVRLISKTETPITVDDLRAFVSQQIAQRLQHTNDTEAVLKTQDMTIAREWVKRTIKEGSIELGSDHGSKPASIGTRGSVKEAKDKNKDGGSGDKEHDGLEREGSATRAQHRQSVAPQPATATASKRPAPSNRPSDEISPRANKRRQAGNQDPAKPGASTISPPVAPESLAGADRDSTNPKPLRDHESIKAAIQRLRTTIASGRSETLRLTDEAMRYQSQHQEADHAYRVA